MSGQGAVRTWKGSILAILNEDMILYDLHWYQLCVLTKTWNKLKPAKASQNDLKQVKGSNERPVLRLTSEK